MNRQVLEHPTDETLTGFALEGGDGEVLRHVEACPSCSRFVKEMGEIKISIESLPDEEVPDRLRRSIRRRACKRKKWMQTLLSFSALHLLKSPIAVGTGLIVAVILLYMYFVFVL